MANFKFESQPQRSGPGPEKPIDLMEIYQRVVQFFDKNLPNIEKGVLEVLGKLQINDLETLIEMSEKTNPPILHRLTPQEIEELKKYLEEAKSGEGYTVHVPTLVSALSKQGIH